MSSTNYTGPDPARNNRLHTYLSTACLHDNHDHCRARENLQGEPKIPATCKWCGAPCICPCHVVSQLDT